MKYPKLVGSSIDPEKLALTVQGLLVGVIPFAIFVAQWFGITLDAGTLGDFAAGVVGLIKVIGSLVAGIMFLVGVVRKIIVAWQTRA